LTQIESSSGPRVVYPDIQTFTALWDPKRLQSIMHNFYSVSVGDPTMQ